MPPAAPEFRMALLELLRQYQGDRTLDVFREGVRLLAEALMELEVSEQVGAGRYERTPERKTYRNGYRERVWETRVERALVSVVQEASMSGGEYPEGRRSGPSPGVQGCSRSEVSGGCGGVGGLSPTLLAEVHEVLSQ